MTATRAECCRPTGLSPRRGPHSGLGVDGDDVPVGVAERELQSERSLDRILDDGHTRGQEAGVQARRILAFARPLLCRLPGTSPRERAKKPAAQASL